MSMHDGESPACQISRARKRVNRNLKPPLTGTNFSLPMHQLQREGLHIESEPDRFFANYLGAPVLQQLERPLIRFSTWPEASRLALQALCIHYAEAMPEADHVVREDVDTRGHAPPSIEGELLLYFGIQGNAAFERCQYTGVAMARRGDAVVFVTYIAGTTEEKGRESRIAAEDPGRLVERRVITSVADVTRLAAEATPVFRIQRDALVAQKGIANSGFCPVFCQRRWNSERRRPETEAAEEVWAYWGRRRAEIAPERVVRERTLLQENNRYRYCRAVAYVRDHVSVEEAYSLALSEHA